MIFYTAFNLDGDHFNKGNQLKSKTKNESGSGVKKKGMLRENIEAILIAVVLALFIRAFVVQAFKIPSGSMKQTLLIGDHILVNKFIYGVKIPFTDITLIPVTKPEQGDIVVFRFPLEPEKDFVKRVVAVEGNVVEVRDKQVYVDGSPLDLKQAMYTDPHIFPKQFQPRDNFGPVTVPEHSIFVMGDNRDHSYDSRFWGFVDLKALRGKAFLIYWSWDKDNFGVRWNRLGKLLK